AALSRTFDFPVGPPSIIHLVTPSAEASRSLYRKPSGPRALQQALAPPCAPARSTCSLAARFAWSSYTHSVYAVPPGERGAPKLSASNAGPPSSFATSFSLPGAVSFTSSEPFPQPSRHDTAGPTSFSQPSAGSHESCVQKSPSSQ